MKNKYIYSNIAYAEFIYHFCLVRYFVCKILLNFTTVYLRQLSLIDFIRNNIIIDFVLLIKSNYYTTSAKVIHRS